MRLQSVALGTVVAMVAAGAVSAADAIFSTWLEPSHIITRVAHVDWAEALKEKSNGELGFEVFSGAVLIPATSTIQGVADGLAQAGHIAAAYNPSDLPISNAVFDLGYATPDMFVLAFAFGDFMMHEQVGLDEFQRNGVVFGGSLAVPPAYFMCKDEVRTLADLRGKRMRMPGGGFGRFGESIGIVPVSMPASEIYTAMERGAIDCACADPTQMTSGATIIDLIDTVILMPLSPNYAAATWIYNRDYWRSLTDAQRRMIFDESARAMARLEMTYDQEATAAFEAAEAQGIAMVEPDEALTNALATWIEDGVGGMADVAKENYGVEDPEALFALYRTYIDKWVGLMQGVDRTDEEAVTRVVKENIFDTLDVSTYGIE